MNHLWKQSVQTREIAAAGVRSQLQAEPGNSVNFQSLLTGLCIFWSLDQIFDILLTAQARPARVLQQLLRMGPDVCRVKGKIA